MPECPQLVMEEFREPGMQREAQVMENSDSDRVLDLSHQYRYAKLNGYYFCLQQSPAVFAWILFLKRDELISVFRGWLRKKQHRAGGYLRHYYRLFLSNFKMIILFMLYRLNLRKINSVLKLPVYGQFCMPAHKGYKVFNLHSRVVAKVFDPDVNKLSILSEIEMLKNVSKLFFAPALKKWNIDEGWYEEDFFTGSFDPSHKSMDSVTMLNAFENEIIPCLTGLILFGNPVTVKSLDYVDKIIKTLEASRLSRQELDSQDIHKAGNFVHSISERLNDQGNSSVHLVFSHGDFCPANILNTKDGIRIVDWENASYRSMLFDFYSYFFFRPVCINLSVRRLAEEINEALPIFTSKLAMKSPQLARDLSELEEVYRCLFYIEFLCKLADREMTDNRLDIRDFISRYIQAFNGYEELLSQGKGTRKR